MTDENLSTEENGNVAKPKLGVVDLCDDCALLDNCSKSLKHSGIQHPKIWCWRSEDTKNMTDEQYL